MDKKITAEALQKAIATMEKGGENASFYMLPKGIVKEEDVILELQQELEIRTNDNADLYAKLCNALMQLNEAEYYLKELPYGVDSYKKYAEKWKIVNK